ncbi:allantoate permease [Pluteus cervinus]|uniref:Allantoate permease n=1 Tax=Pluteus cervinus TaxID=181527 RepID=A0ACD3B5Y0_9AGAR|nr:allantoate permease [Pluteus cervinus]
MDGPSSCPLATTSSTSSQANSSIQRLESPPSTTDDIPGSCAIRDEALVILSQAEGAAYNITEEENRRVLRKIDLYLMPILVGVYFLQFMDKQTLAFASVFGIGDDTHLVRNQYSLLGSIVYVAQLFFQPLSAYFLVRLRLSLYVPFVVTCWGATLACMAAATNFDGLFILRFFLGGFESSILPAFVLIGQIWYRRQEQGFRIALWYANNGWGNVFGSLIMFGLGHIRSNTLHSYQLIFLLLGTVTVLVGIICFFVFPDNPVKSKFLTPEDKLIAVERLRANQQGLETKQFKFSQATEMLLDIKSWCWMVLMFSISVPAGGILAFGPFILQGFGFDGYDVMLLSIPFGLLQVATILASSWVSQKFRMKSPAILVLLIPCLVGAGILRGCGRTRQDQPALITAYYLLSCHTAIIPLILNWHSTNVAGHTKKTTTTAFTTMGHVGGNIVGPLLFTSSEAPGYSKGLSVLLASFCVCAAMVCITVAYLAYLNKWNERRRVAAGKPAKLVDYSMLTIEETREMRAKEAEGAPDQAKIGKRAFDDLTDLQNDEFIYVY